MYCPACSNSTKLLIQKIKESDTTFPSCKQCGISIASKTGFYQCSTCKYSLCPNCKVCKKNHLLIKVKSLKCMGEQLYGANKYSCDSCSVTKLNNPEGVWHCRICSFDICDSCIKPITTNYPVRPLQVKSTVVNPATTTLIVKTNEIPKALTPLIKKKPLSESEESDIGFNLFDQILFFHKKRIASKKEKMRKLCNITNSPIFFTYFKMKSNLILFFQISNKVLLLLFFFSNQLIKKFLQWQKEDQLQIYLILPKNTMNLILQNMYISKIVVITFA